MQMTYSDFDGIGVVGIVGRLDTTTYSDLETYLNSLYSKGVNQLVLDCTRMDYVSSSGLRVFLLALKRLKATGGSLVICGLQPTIHNVFEISGFLSIFNIKDNCDQALAALL